MTVDHLDIYLSVDEAGREIAKRWENEALKKEVIAFVKDIPQPMLREPRAWLDRYIASPDYEMFRFFSLAEQAGLKPLVVESLGDRFHRFNTDKLCLAEMAFLELGNPVIHKAGIIDLKKNHMKSFSSIQTLWGESFVGFHHQIYHKYAKGMEHFDASPWFSAQGKSAKEYYPALLSLFLCHGILFEDFVTNPAEEVFSQEVVLPAFEKVQRLFGLRPLIVRIYSNEELKQPEAWCYPESMRAEISTMCH